MARHERRRDARRSHRRLARVLEPGGAHMRWRVPRRGVEPLSPCGRRILSPLRLPVPPPRPGASESSVLHGPQTTHRASERVNTMMNHRRATASARADVNEALVNLNARVPRHLWRRVRLQCLRDERLLRTFITEALREYLHGRPAR